MSSTASTSSASTNGIGAHPNGIPTPITPVSNGGSPLHHPEGFEAGGHYAGLGYAGPSNGNGVNGFAPPSVRTHNEDIVNHLYHAGFQIGNYADTILNVHQNTYRLHAIILSRSPLLAHLMSTSPQPGGQRTIYVPLEHEPEVTQEGFAIALGYLYSSVSLSLIRPDNARAVLAAGCLLGGMDNLCQYAYESCKQSITVDSISQWVDFVGRLPQQQPLVPSPTGTSTPEYPAPIANSVFGPYAQKIRDDVFHFLVITLPETLDVQNTGAASVNDQANGRDLLLQIFSRVPFELFKAVIETPDFQIGSDQARFKFAKDAIEMRKQGIARGNGAEETVVLAFGGGNFGGSTVHVTRKTRKRQLWKVNA